MLCDEVLEAKPTDDGILTAMMHALRGLGRRTFSRLIFNSSSLYFDYRQ